jgi:hypothetical protein
MSEHDHGHEGHTHEHDEGYGMALGFRIVEDGGQLFLAEAEITPYVDEPSELGVTLVFHPLEGLDPVEATEDEERPAYPVDLDDDLTRDTSEPIAAQFQAILRQLRGFSEDQLRDYLRMAREQE